jgi:polyisoprenoid-binding protein YceI
MLKNRKYIGNFFGIQSFRFTFAFGILTFPPHKITFPIIMKTKWTIDSSQSDVMIKNRHSIIGYLDGTIHKFKGHVDIRNNELEDASIEFVLDVNNSNSTLEQIDTHLKLNDIFATNEYPAITFKSTSFQKVNKNINFLKGNLTIKNITKIIELDAEFIGINTTNGIEKAAFEIVGKINRKDFGLQYNSFAQSGGLAIGQDIKLIANLEFTA